jgi:protein-S-isoprenylcysteine O-methyltransferase Ste14
VTSLYARIMASRWGYNVFGRAVPSAFFLLGLLGGLRRLPDPAAVVSGGSPFDALMLLQELLGVFIGVCLVVLFAIRKRPVGKPSSLLGAVVALSASYYGAFVIFFNTLGFRQPDPNAPPVVVGLAAVVTSLGACLLAVSVVYLGRHFGVFPEARGLVTSGPYRVLRHPIYVAYLLGAGGALAISFSPTALLVFLLYYALVAWRAALEERALEDAFGDRYRSYRASTFGVGPPHLAPGGHSASSHLSPSPRVDS